MQVLLAKHKADSSFYAVKVLQKKVILKKKEVGGGSNVTLCCKEHRLHTQTHLQAYKCFMLIHNSNTFNIHRGLIKNEVVKFRHIFFSEVTQGR